MEAQIITDRQQWDDFVGASECCNITQSYEWGELARHVGALEPLRVGVVDAEGKPCAVMLILVSRAPVLNRIYFYAPHGPVMDDPGSPGCRCCSISSKRRRASVRPSCWRSSRA